ncbi:hypothetical protein PTSG_02623 [Salpingoeca rosetta]|uniref:Uncharacterized protein n=1 Tax=Salpingoeca rosetta (strain ATCC 50818 / BSB-021) TaxID=946362 RepID=F2U2U3_SALR5|nr:uncharacterized protein PTSG_02623 [Salpingoeca rosetta]EGD81937.1 hypothetical protein PTSG_02623 [Salpingoeca rosetta]|eukprot:XP_004996120.1 hypothetical protein PTSG_02623 [Salpingoeca rosetta]
MDALCTTARACGFDATPFVAWPHHTPAPRWYLHLRKHTRHEAQPGVGQEHACRQPATPPAYCSCLFLKTATNISAPCILSVQHVLLDTSDDGDGDDSDSGHGDEHERRFRAKDKGMKPLTSAEHVVAVNLRRAMGDDATFEDYVQHYKHTIHPILHPAA